MCSLISVPLGAVVFVSIERHILITSKAVLFSLTTLLLEQVWVSLLAQMVKCLSAMREIPVRFLGWEDPLKKGRLPTPVFWPGEFHGLCSPWVHKEVDTSEPLSLTMIKSHKKAALSKNVIHRFIHLEK